MIIENGVFEIFEATTEIIYKPLSMLRGLLHFNQNERTDYHVPFKKSALQRVDSNLMEFWTAFFSLAIEINLDFVMWGMNANGQR
jgi:hypothetical protein